MTARSFNPIVPQVCVSTSLTGLSDWAERVWWRWVSQADSHGRYFGSAGKVWAGCTPTLGRTQAEVQAALDELGEAGLLVFYQADGETLAFCPTWDRHQPADRLSKRAKLSSFPDPPPSALSTANGKSGQKPPARSRTKPEQPKAAASGREADPIWDALVEAIGHSPETKSERGAWNKAAKEFRDAGIGPERIIAAGAAHRLQWPSMTVTATSLAKHVAQLAPAGNPTTDAEQWKTTAWKWAKTVGPSLRAPDFKDEIDAYVAKGLDPAEVQPLIEWHALLAVDVLALGDGLTHATRARA